MQVIIHKLSEIIATFFYFGKSPVAPGTIGTIAGVALFLVIQHFATNSISIHLFVFILICAIGYFATQEYIKTNPMSDPTEVVIDEVIGLYCVIICGLFIEAIIFNNRAIFSEKFMQNMENNSIIPSNITNWINAVKVLAIFALFRLFDITKPLIIGLVDKHIHGALGIILDDVLAGLFAFTVYIFGYMALLFFV